MKGRQIGALVVVLVGALAMSSALLAGQPARGSGASTLTADTAVWGHHFDGTTTTTGSGHGTQVIRDNQVRTDGGKAPSQMIDALLKKLRAITDTTTWGFGPPIR